MPAAVTASAKTADLVGHVLPSVLPALHLRAGSLVETGAQIVAVPVHPAAAEGAATAAVLGAGADEALALLGISVADAAGFLAREGATGEAGQLSVWPVAGGGAPHTVLFVGAGDRISPTLDDARAVGAALARASAKAERLATTAAAHLDRLALRTLVEALVLAAYSFTQKNAPKPRVLVDVDLVLPKPPNAKLVDAVARACTTAAAVCTARDLINTPSLEKTPAWLAAQATRLAKGNRVSVAVLDERDLAAQGFGGILAVGSGSTRPPRLIRLDYVPAGKPNGHVVLVGKGITFDSGGLSIKPNDGMIAMKTDMGGGAAVIATLCALAALGVRTLVTGLIATAENLPSGSATRPGDVITHWGGTTVEVLNTDAEGRLVLADALAYASSTLAPDAIIDIATLTGAISVGLGKKTAGLFATDAALASRVRTAAQAAGERVWRMPLTEDYRDALDSPVADLTNIGRAASYQGGSIVAALFLREFTGSVPWAHLDIAGTGRSDAEEREIVKGGTGFGVRTFLRLLESW